MGTSGWKATSVREEHKSVYRVKPRDTAAMKKVWQIVEYDLSYYGSSFSNILFRNHPQYIKYFHEENIPEFVQDAKIRKKFSAVCTVASALFIDYSRKPHRRDHLLGYIAMIHKDMQLSLQDFENFMMDLLQMLAQEIPRAMSAECTLVHVRYVGGLLPRISQLMQIQRERDAELLERHRKPSEDKEFCGCSLSACDSPSIYGRSLDHWIQKKQYWQIKMAFWSSIDMELSGMASFLSLEKYRHDDAPTKVNQCRSSKPAVSENPINPLLKTINQLGTVLNDFESVTNVFESLSLMASGGQDKVDPVIGLSEREINMVQSTWAPLTKDLVASGLDVMLSLLDAYPEYQSLFEAFKDVPRDELPRNKKFQAHGVNVAKALNTIIENLTNANRLIPHLEGLGARHYKRGLNKQRISKITPVMVDVLRRNLGRAFTKEVEEAWVKTMTKAWSIMYPRPTQNS